MQEKGFDQVDDGNPEDIQDIDQDVADDAGVRPPLEVMPAHNVVHRNMTIYSGTNYKVTKDNPQVCAPHLHVTFKHFVLTVILIMLYFDQTIFFLLI